MNEASLGQPGHFDALFGAAPRHLPDACAATRGGLAGCRACADVCPHDALRFTDRGPAIDGDACRRCGACTAACPLGALQRSFLPDHELFALVAGGADAEPSLLILTCDHDPATRDEAVIGQVSVALPCIQLVSDDLLVFAMARGAQSVLVTPGASCPHAPFVQPRRAVETARAVLESRGWDRVRIAMARSEIVDETGHGPLLSRVVVPGGVRYERRATLLRLERTGSEASHGALPATTHAPWRRVVVDERACTACGACAFVCPTDALVLAEAGAALYGREASCIGCELCSRACPEDAITLLPTVPADVTPRLLARPDGASCHGCGRPFLPEPLVRHVEKALAGTGAASRAALRLCERCKGTHLFHGATESAPRAAGESQCNAGVSAAGADGPEPIAIGGDLPRRAFLQSAAQAAMGVAALAAYPTPAAGGDRPRRYGMVIDTRRCVGCGACVVACKTENKTPPGVNYMLVTNNTLGERPDDKPLFTAKPCFHCEHPPCVDVCPVSATFKREQDGIVVVDYDRCIGCRYCQTACPYGARFFDFGENYAAETADGVYRPPSPEYNQFRPRVADASPIGNVRKCTFCLHLQDEHGEYDRAAGRWPACAKTCTGHAIYFGDFADPDSQVSRLIRERQPVRLKDELGTEPNVSYLL